jgi:hypothetical protein
LEIVGGWECSLFERSLPDTPLAEGSRRSGQRPKSDGGVLVVDGADLSWCKYIVVDADVVDAAVKGFCSIQMVTNK